MSRKEEILTILDGVKTLVIALLSALFGLLGYTVINYKSLDITQIVAMGVGGIFLLAVLSILLKLYIRKLKQLRDL